MAWKKGTSGNKTGRPKRVDSTTLLNSIFVEADGDAVKFQQLVLKNAQHLELDLSTALRIARDLAVYQTPRKASVETKTDDTKTIVLRYDFPVDKNLLDSDVNSDTLKVIEGNIIGEENDPSISTPTGGTEEPE